MPIVVQHQPDFGLASYAAAYIGADERAQREAVLRRQQEQANVQAGLQQQQLAVRAHGDAEDRRLKQYLGELEIADRQERAMSQEQLRRELQNEAFDRRDAMQADRFDRRGQLQEDNQEHQNGMLEQRYTNQQRRQIETLARQEDEVNQMESQGYGGTPEGRRQLQWARDQIRAQRLGIRPSTLPRQQVPAGIGGGPGGGPPGGQSAEDMVGIPGYSQQGQLLPGWSRGSTPTSTVDPEGNEHWLNGRGERQMQRGPRAETVGEWSTRRQRAIQTIMSQRPSGSTPSIQEIDDFMREEQSAYERSRQRVNPGNQTQQQPEVGSPDPIPGDNRTLRQMEEDIRHLDGMGQVPANVNRERLMDFALRTRDRIEWMRSRNANSAMESSRSIQTQITAELNSPTSRVSDSEARALREIIGLLDGRSLADFTQSQRERFIMLIAQLPDGLRRQLRIGR